MGKEEKEKRVDGCLILFCCLSSFVLAPSLPPSLPPHILLFIPLLAPLAREALQTSTPHIYNVVLHLFFLSFYRGTTGSR